MDVLVPVARAVPPPEKEGSTQTVTFQATDARPVDAILTCAPRPRGLSPHASWRAPLVIVLHDEGGNAHEYADLARRFSSLGYDTLAPHLRHGCGSHDSGRNATVDNYYHGVPVLAATEAIRDINGALRWAALAAYERVVAVGSAVSGTLLFFTDPALRKALSGMAVFSPRPTLFNSSSTLLDVLAVARDVDTFTYVTSESTPEGQSAAVRVAAAVPRPLAMLVVARFGLRGTDTLNRNKNLVTWGENVHSLLSFIQMCVNTTR
jgi:dienelactone hydrolase